MENNLNTFYNYLVQNLLNDLVYYIPKSIIPDELLKELNEKIPKHYFDCLSVIDIEEGILYYEFDEYNERLLAKNNSLENDLFKLLKKKQEFESVEFEYILNKYKGQVEFYFFIGFWLHTNLKKFYKNVDLNIVSSFQFQHIYFKLHMENLLKQFYANESIPLKKSYTAEELLEVYIPDLISKLELSVEKNTVMTINQEITLNREFENTSTKAPSELKTLKRLKKRKKESLVTEAMADEYILKTVFNVKFKGDMNESIN